MLHDDLTPLQRAALLAAGRSVDRLPTVPIIGNTAARVLGVKVSALRANGPLLAQAQIAAYRLFGYDNIRLFTDLYTLAEAMGSVIRTPDDETAYLDRPAITDVSQISTLRPADPHHDGNLPHFLEATRIAQQELAHEVPITAALTCPFTNASLLIGAEPLVRLTLKEPASVHALCQLSLDSALRYAQAVLDLGATPSLTDAMSSCTVVSPRIFRKFSLPYLKPLIDLIHSRGKKATLHICGKTRPIWPLMADAGADTLSIDNDADLAEAKASVGHRVRLMGNVKPAETMLQGSPADVRQAVIACVEQAHDNPRGYIIASGCSLPTETPFANIHAMLNTARELGYPPKAPSGLSAPSNIQPIPARPQ